MSYTPHRIIPVYMPRAGINTQGHSSNIYNPEDPQFSNCGRLADCRFNQRGNLRAQNMTHNSSRKLWKLQTTRFIF
jgi:hypothetical protein